MKYNKNNNTFAKKIGVVIILFILIYSIFNKVFSLFKVNEVSNDNSYYIVTQEYEFIIINQCISKYVNALNNKNPKEILDIYNVKYKKENNITEENVLQVNKSLDIVYFKINKLYKDNINYYALGAFYTDNNNTIEKNNFEITIHLYRDHTFSIIPKIQVNLMQGE